MNERARSMAAAYRATSEANSTPADRLADAILAALTTRDTAARLTGRAIYSSETPDWDAVNAADAAAKDASVAMWNAFYEAVAR